MSAKSCAKNGADAAVAVCVCAARLGQRRTGGCFVRNRRSVQYTGIAMSGVFDGSRG